MAELLITSSLDPVNEGDMFPKGTSLPRHVTVWQYFDLPEEHRDGFIADAGSAVSGFEPLWIRGTENADFGLNNDVSVRRLKAFGKNATLMTLHSVLGAVIERHDGTIANPEWAYEGYNPHVTYVNGRALEENESTQLHTVELFEKDPDTKAKIARKVWNLEEL